jgi:hypothetical protein
VLDLDRMHGYVCIQAGFGWLERHYEVGIARCVYLVWLLEKGNSLWTTCRWNWAARKWAYRMIYETILHVMFFLRGSVNKS